MRLVAESPLFTRVFSSTKRWLALGFLKHQHVVGSSIKFAIMLGRCYVSFSESITCTFDRIDKYIYTVKANYIFTADDPEIRRMTERMIYPSNRICHK